MLPFNFHCLILSQLNSHFFQDHSRQALNSPITFWPQRDGESPHLPEHQGPNSSSMLLMLWASAPWGTDLTWVAHTHFYYSFGEVNMQLYVCRMTSPSWFSKPSWLTPKHFSPSVQFATWWDLLHPHQPCSFAPVLQLQMRCCWVKSGRHSDRIHVVHPPCSQEWMSIHTAEEALWDSHGTSAFSRQCHDAPHHNIREKFKHERCLQDTGSKSSCPLMGPRWSVVLHFFKYLKQYCKPIFS